MRQNWQSGRGTVGCAPPSGDPFRVENVEGIRFDIRQLCEADEGMETKDGGSSEGVKRERRGKRPTWG